MITSNDFCSVSPRGHVAVTSICLTSRVLANRRFSQRLWLGRDVKGIAAQTRHSLEGVKKVLEAAEEYWSSIDQRTYELFCKEVLNLDIREMDRLEGKALEAKVNEAKLGRTSHLAWMSQMGDTARGGLRCASYPSMKSQST